MDHGFQPELLHFFAGTYDEIVTAYFLLKGFHHVPRLVP